MRTLRDMIEMGLGLGSVVGLSWLIPNAWRESHLIFCAFFMVVFAIAVRSQSIVAYSASVLAALCYGLLLWLHPEMRVQPNFLYVALEPALLLISGICTSDILRWQRQRFTALTQEHARRAEKLQQTHEQYQRVLALNETLERQIAGQPTSLLTMSDKIARLWRLHGDERYAALLDLILYALEAQSCALYLLHDKQWSLRAERSNDGSLHPLMLNLDDPLMKRVIEQREVSTLLDSLAGEQHASQSLVVMAGPLINESGEMVGMVVIDQLSLLKLTPGTVRLFRSLLQIVPISFQAAKPAAKVCLC